MENTEQITIITTLRVDSSERQRNMDAVLRYLQAYRYPGACFGSRQGESLYDMERL